MTDELVVELVVLSVWGKGSLLVALGVPVVGGGSACSVVSS